jgi:ABC-type transport system involved in cytochrome bd biosynthesis fused ATPase/permease subunit
MRQWFTKKVDSILNEPSTTLDPVGELQIFELLTRLAQDTIILFTTHRYDTIRRAHHIVVLADGKLPKLVLLKNWSAKLEHSGHYILDKDRS